MSLWGVLFSYWTPVALILSVCAYYLATYNLDFFRKRGVPFVKPIPLFGNYFNVIFQRECVHLMFERFYNMFPKSRFYGMFELTTPVYVIRDPELVKQITVKDFDHFLNHRAQIDETIEPLFGRNLFVMKNNKWRQMRSVLSPSFTGSKMRLMFELIEDCSKKTVSYITSQMTNDTLELDMKDFFTRFASDVIATTAFGLEINSFSAKNNDFYVMGKRISNFKGLQGLKFFAFASWPNMMKFFKIPFFDKYVRDFFRALVKANIDERERLKIVRHDMINLLMQARKGYFATQENDSKYDNAGFATAFESDVRQPALQDADDHIKWEADDITAQCVVFFLGGFDTSSQLMCFVCHELAVNQDVQQKLRDEIDAAMEELDGKPLRYEELQNMKYMDMVVSEALRKWPPGAANDRQCNKPFMLENNDGSRVQMNVGDGLWIPVYSFHHDPNYFPNPDKFDPERFSDENKKNIKPFTYMPFGMGPRNCIGSRFALLECKAIIAHILTSFYLERSPKTQHPLKLLKSALNMMPEKGFWLQLRRRN